MKRKNKISQRLIGAAFLIALALAGYALYRSGVPAKMAKVTVSLKTTTQPKTVDPIQIEAIKQRQYTASPITTEQNFGEQRGYSMSIVSYRSDGFKIDALQMVPDGAEPAGGWPVIILNHGYIPPTQYQTNGPYNSWMAPMARAGFVVIKPDYRGFANSEGVPEGGHFSPVYAYDDLNLIASLKSYGLVNAKRIGLFGHSMGGHTSLRVIVVSKDIKATVIAGGVVGSFYDIFYNWPNSPAPLDQPEIVQTDRQNLINKFGTPQSDPKFWDSASAINYVGNITGAIQLHQSQADEVVPKIFSDHLADALQKAHKPVEYFTYQSDDHNFSVSLSLMLQRTITFYQAHL